MADQSWETTLDLAAAGGVADPHAETDYLLKSIGKGIHIVEQVDSLVSAFAEAGRRIPKAKQLRTGLVKLRRLRDIFIPCLLLLDEAALALGERSLPEKGIQDAGSGPAGSAGGPPKCANPIALR